MDRRDFLKSSALVASSVALSPIAKAEALSEKLDPILDGGETLVARAPRRWRNWSRSVSVTPKQIAYPKNLADLQDLVRQASGRIRAVGSGHSFNDCAPSKDTLVRTDYLCRILNVDVNAREITVEAGMKLKHFNQAIWDLGFALPSMGDIQDQSMGGLVSTGTHGTGMRHGSFSDESSLVAVTLVDAAGNVRSFSQNRVEDHDALRAVRVGLGCMGIIYSLTFKVIEAHNLRLISRVVPLAEALNSKHWLENDHYEFFYMPFTGNAQMVFRNPTKDRPNRRRASEWFNDFFIQNIVLDHALRYASLHPAKLPGMWRKLSGLATPENYVQRSYEVMTSIRRFRFHEQEYALPIENAARAMEVVEATIHEFATTRDEYGRYYHYNLPVEVRFMKADHGTLLSHAEGRETCYIDLSSHWAFTWYEPFFRKIEERLLALGGKPHWGKQFYKNPKHLYADFDQWNQFRLELDPDGKFLNDYAARVINGVDL